MDHQLSIQLAQSHKWRDLKEARYSHKLVRNSSQSPASSLSQARYLHKVLSGKAANGSMAIIAESTSFEPAQTLPDIEDSSTLAATDRPKMVINLHNSLMQSETKPRPTPTAKGSSFIKEFNNYRDGVIFCHIFLIIFLIFFLIFSLIQ